MTRLGFHLKKPIGLAYTMDEDDVLKTKIALRDLGHMKRPEYGLTPYPDQPMIDGIRDFQRKSGLRTDGVVKPGGPTEQRLDANLAALPLGDGLVDGRRKSGCRNRAPVNQVAAVKGYPWNELLKGMGVGTGQPRGQACQRPLDERFSPGSLLEDLEHRAFNLQRILHL